MERKGIPYSRFSGKRQEAGVSQIRQDEMAVIAARDEGVELDLSCCLNDKGLSAFRGANWKRGKLGKFIDLCDAGLILPGWVLIVERVNRMSRAPWMVQVEQWKEILRRGIILRTCEPPARFTLENINDLSVGCPVVIHMMLAHLDSKQKSEWVGDAWRRKKEMARETKEPHGQRCPRWLQPITKPHSKDPNRLVTTGYQVIEERAAVIRMLFEWSVSGWGPRRICAELRLRGVKAWVPSGRWVAGSIYYLLRNRQVLGEHQPTQRNQEGRPVPLTSTIKGYYPAILDESLWLAAQSALRRRTNRGGRGGKQGRETNLFTHVVFEALTREVMHCQDGESKGRKYHYLINKSATWKLPYSYFERGVLSALAALKPEDVDGRHQADALSAAVSRLQDECSRLTLELEALDQQIRELHPKKWPQRVVARMGELEEAIKAKKEELRQTEEMANTSGRAKMLTDLQTCLQLLDEVRGTERETVVRQRIKGRIPFLVESIWVRVQPINKMQRYLHTRIYLHGGEPRYFAIFAGRGKPSAPAWNLKDVDFRAGEKDGQTARGKATRQLLTGTVAG